MPIRRALLSVSDKTHLADFGRGLHELGVELVSTGGTARHLAEHGIPVTKVADVTGFPEILDGRVKTLHPKIHGGILADRRLEEHRQQLDAHGITGIDLVVVNLYPFEQTVAQGASYDETIEMIDIGGPCMVRAAAKNHANVAVVVDPNDYAAVLETLHQEGDLHQDLRRRLALAAFRHTRDYDSAIAEWLEAEANERDTSAFPARLRIELVKEFEPRYGENPHQGAAVYRHGNGSGLFDGMEQLQGKELSWNNLLDADAARRMVALFDGSPAVVIVKHNNPCGIGIGASLSEAYERALATDPTSAFGSIIALNGPVDEAVAALLAKLFVEVIVAPGFEAGARALLGKKKNLRLLECPMFQAPAASGAWGAADLDLRSIGGGFLAQQLDAGPDQPEAWTCPTRRQPSDSERRALAFAWKVGRAVKSNAIVITNEVQTVGIGAGQMSRVDSCRLAIDKAELSLTGTVAASDAFFPFRDGLDVLAEAGVTAIIQPGGSKRDGEVVEAADEHGIALLHTGRRHFRH